KSLKAYSSQDGSQYAHIALGKLYQRTGKHGEALKNLEKALSLSENLADDISLLQTLIALGNLYVEMGNESKALTYYAQAEKMASGMPANDDIKDLSLAMATAYDITQDY